MFNYEALIQQCDAEIRSGQAHNVSRRLHGLNLARVPRIWRLKLAQIARRAGLWNLGLHLLTTLIYPRNPKIKSDASDGERAEYGMLLLRIGATNEAQLLLDTVDTTRAPEALQYRALVRMTRWEFDLAIRDLMHFLNSSPPSYAALVGRVNLALAHIECGHYEIAGKILDETIDTSQAEGQTRLLCISLAYRAQMHIQNGEFSAAQRDIARGESQLETAKTGDRLLFLKWKLILAGLESSSAAPLRELHQIALENRSWEDVRLADLYSLKAKFEHGRFLHLIFGTPFEGFRRLLTREFQQYSERTIYYLGPKSSPRLDLRTGEILNADRPHTPLAAGGKCHQLIEILLRDFYHPLRIAGIFSELFPNENFNPSSSPDRVHAVLIRTRGWLKENKIPVEIREFHGFYSLIINGNFSFRIPLERKPVDLMSLHFEKLRAEFPGNAPFTAKQARERLDVARQTFQRIVNWGIAQGLIERQGENKNACYRFTGRSRKAS